MIFKFTIICLYISFLKGELLFVIELFRHGARQKLSGSVSTEGG